ncbi:MULTISPECIES: strawberry notch C-terminal domain-containing protein [unclassified Coleofasciculus]|uniref:strawberry notch C-terminal domain-containing protein n=1 Tax=unclassified Coleofasciculus TaxID=2692782 RepID=UPI00187FB915|nr:MULTISPECIES: strawberry notch C-terminal domain-containing protein [unclassified Coleofasciculus]MBE9124719.1 strawberry notch family protein [Coleofasciculus sp. LEGE 07081]MBE9151844.1 strawberry notch family protein [Coleofasciculus sp. LEGE 07092]
MAIADKQRHRLREALRDRFLAGAGFSSIREARSWAKAQIGQDFQPGTANAKALEETIEESLVAAGRKLIQDAGDNPWKSFRDLVELYQRQPPLGTRSSSSVQRQAYSTPLPIAHLASVMAGIDLQGTVYEPAAGNGALLMSANPERVSANEIDGVRAKALQEQGFKVTTQDATTYKPDQKYDFVIANPPFGSIPDPDNPQPNAKKRWQVGELNTRQIDHAICLKSLEALKDDGKAVLIIGGVMGNDPMQRSDRYNSLANRGFFKELYDTWNVIDHFSVSGDLYSRQGAGFPIDVIAIDGRGKSDRSYPAADVPPVYHSFEELEQEVLSNYVSAKSQLLDADFRTAHTRDANAALLDSRGSSSVHAKDSLNERISATAGIEGSLADSPGTSFRRTANHSRRDAPFNERRDFRRAADASESGHQPNSRSVGESLSHQQPRNLESSGFVLESAISRPGANQFRTNNRSEGIDSEFQSGGVARADEGDANRVLEPKSQSVSEDKRMSNHQELQVSYQPFSKGKPLNSLVPKNMSAGIRKSLESVQEKQGDIDNYVAREMDWSRDELYEKLSAEQIDAVALSLKNFEDDAETILGDMTGIGKGRVVASMIRKAKLEGLTPIFVTENPNLYRDMHRDLEDIGEDINPYYTDSHLTMDTKGGEKIHYSAQSHKNQEREILETGNLGDKDSIFTTYSQMQTVAGKEPERRQILRKFAPSAMLIMDESHNAGGSGGGRESLMSKTGIPNRAGFTRELKKSAAKSFSSSATYAKNPGVMDLYSGTDMKKAVEDVQSLVSIVQDGGIPMQQVLASQLSESGQYIRRERSYEGVDFDNKIFPTDRQMTDDEAAVMQGILEFDRAKDRSLHQLDKSLKEEAKELSRDNSTGLAGAESTNFTSLMHNYLDASNLAKKTQGAIDLAKESLEKGEKPILTVSNTMGKFLSQYAQDNGLETGDVIDADFGDMLKRYLERSREVIVRNHHGESSRRRLTDEELGEEGIRAYEEALARIENCDFSRVPISPIDNIRFQLEESGYTTGEITGRSDRVEYERNPNGELVGRYAKRPASESSRAGKAQAVDDFNNGTIDCLTLNRSGATGISLHSSERFSDQQRRHMIVVQPERDVNQAVQMFGRVHRTGQVNAPKITIGAGDNPSEKRTMAILMGKLASLNANTTANREGQIDFENATDFLNEIGDKVVADIIKDNFELDSQLDFPLNDELEGTARRVTGRMALLSLPEQEDLMSEIEEEYQGALEREMAMGRNPLKAETLDLEARTIASVEAQPPDPGSTSPFTGAVMFEVMDVKKNRQPLTTMAAMNTVRAELGLEQVSDSQECDRQELEVAGREQGHQLSEAIESLAQDWKERRRDLFKTESSRQKFEEIIERQKNTVLDTIDKSPVGQTVRLKTPENSVYYGVIAGHQSSAKEGKDNPVSPSKWKATVLLADPVMQLSIPHSKIGKDYEVSPQSVDDFEGKDIFSLFDEYQGSSRELRGMFRGNLVRAAEKHLSEGKMVNFTDSHGEIQPGLLMGRKFNLAESLENMPVKIPSAEKVEEFTRSYGRSVSTRAENLTLEFNNRAEEYVMTTGKSKSQGGEFFLDQKLLDAAGGGEFYSVGRSMEMSFSPEHLGAVVERLDEKGGLYATGADIPLAREMLGEELPDLSGLSPENLQLSQQRLQGELEAAAVETVAELEAGESVSPKQSDRPEADSSLGVPKQSDRLEADSSLGVPIQSDRPEVDASLGVPIQSDRPEVDSSLGVPIQSDRPDADQTQQHRVEAVAPVVLKHLKEFVKNDHYQGSQHRANWDDENQRLIVADNQSGEKKIEAHKAEDGSWKNSDSHLSEKDLKHFQKLAEHQRAISSKKGEVAEKIKQQNRVNQMAPTIVKHLSLMNRLSVKGRLYESNLDPEESKLSLTKNATGETVLSAKFQGNSWRDTGSQIDDKTFEFFEKSVKPRVNEAVANRSERERLERQKQDAQQSL